MVKNTGGNKAKKFARKVINMPDRSTRFAVEEGEVYAIVMKLMGNNICEVLCLDGERRLCVIRKKFSGKGKRDNFLSKGRWVLIGLRSWEVTRKEKEKCDLLEVYNDNNKEALIKNGKVDFRPFILSMLDEDENDSQYIQFMNLKEDEFENKQEEDEKDENEIKNLNIISSEDEDEEEDEDEIEWYEEEEFRKDKLEENNNEEKVEKLGNITDNMQLININDI